MPWLHLYVDTDGLAKACCDANIVFGNINTQTIEEIWQGEPIRKFRKSLLEGYQDKRCSSCFSKERAGKSSIRMETLQKFKHHLEWVKETDLEGYSNKATPIYFDIRFNNLCNLRCRTCWHGASSSWFDEAKQLKQNLGNKAIIEASEDGSSFFEQLIRRSVEVEEIYFAGGEPLMMREHYDWLEGLINLGQTHVRLRYNSNLSVLKLKSRDVIEFWKHFKSVTVSASIDDLGTRGEYIRKGLSWKIFLDNIKTIKSNVPHVKLEIAPTISVFNILTLGELHRFFVEEQIIDINSIYLNVLSRPDYYNLKICPNDIKLEARQSLEKHISWLRQRDARRQVIMEFESILSFMEAEDWSIKLPKLKKQLTLLDRMRDESYEDLFPELKQALDLF